MEHFLCAKKFYIISFNLRRSICSAELLLMDLHHWHLWSDRLCPEEEVGTTIPRMPFSTWFLVWVCKPGKMERRRREGHHSWHVVAGRCRQVWGLKHFCLSCVRVTCFIEIYTNDSCCIIFFWWYGGLKSGCCNFLLYVQAGLTLILLSVLPGIVGDDKGHHHTQPLVEMGSQGFLPVLTLNCDPPDSCLPSS
jgi:hypothetical protein